MIVAIDGPAGAGKSTTARAVARRLGLGHIDTGATYRLVAWRALDSGVPLDDEAALAALAADTMGRTTLGEGSTLAFDGTPVGNEIRTAEVSDATSRISALPGVRAALVPTQRSLAPSAGAVVEGRDIGTVVWPDAALKIYLDADTAVRAQRRGSDARAGLAASDAVAERDRRDASRPVGAMRPAHDAVRIDTTDLDAEAVTDRIVALMAPPDRGDLLYRGIRGTLKVLLHAIFRLDIVGAEHVPARGSFILAPNHRSLVDIPVAAAVTDRKLWFMAKEELFGDGKGGKLLTRLGAFPVRRGRPDRGALNRSLQLLADGQPLVIFPEGTRTPDARFEQLEEGFAYIALKSGAPIIPVAIDGTGAIRPPNTRRPRLVRIRAVVGEPFTLGGPTSGVLPRSRVRDAVADATERFAHVIQEAEGR